jgi:hypothetical protein
MDVTRTLAPPTDGDEGTHQTNGVGAGGVDDIALAVVDNAATAAAANDTTIVSIIVNIVASCTRGLVLNHSITAAVVDTVADDIINVIIVIVVVVVNDAKEAWNAQFQSATGDAGGHCSIGFNTRIRNLATRCQQLPQHD